MEQRPGKNKAIAIVIAIAAPPLTWLYTYSKDAAKFWIGLLASKLGFGGAFVGLIGLLIGQPTLAYLIGLVLLNVIVLIWAVIDTTTKTDEWYKNYYV